MPPHAGHVFLADFARNHCDELTILVCSLEREPIPGELRLGWMRELFPDCRVLHLNDDIPQQPDDSPKFWDIWREAVRRYHPEPIDYVYASEPYGEQLASELGARFVPVDGAREALAVSATTIRADPMANWRYLPVPVRPYFVRRVCLFGPESTGKTTLARQLAAHFDTVHVPEYGRTYTDTWGVDCGGDDLRHIARGQAAAGAAAARAANRVLIMDTDPLLTAIWAQMLTGARDPVLDALRDPADLYLLTGVDMPWVNDGTRYFPDEAARRRFYELCETELSARALTYVAIEGPPDTRLTAAIKAIHTAFPGV